MSSFLQLKLNGGNLQGLDNGVKMQPAFHEAGTPFG
jgi:hypothetical protein